MHEFALFRFFFQDSVDTLDVVPMARQVAIPQEAIPHSNAVAADLLLGQK
jgi:hypothetical protein